MTNATAAPRAADFFCQKSLASEKSGAQKPTAPAETLFRTFVMHEIALRRAPRAQKAEKSGAQKPTAPAETLFRAFVMQETALRGAPRAQNAKKGGAQKPTAPAETLFQTFVMQETDLRGAPRAQNAKKSDAQKPTAPAETLFRTFVMHEIALRRAPRAQNAKKSDAQPRAKSLSAEKEFEHPKNMRALPSARVFSSRYDISPPQKGHFFIRTRKAATEVVRSFFGKFLDKTRRDAA